MRGARRIQVRSYRSFRLEILDEPEGWRVIVYPPDGADRVVLRNRVPNGLEVLLGEARLMVDRRLDGSPLLGHL